MNKETYFKHIINKSIIVNSNNTPDDTLMFNRLLKLKQKGYYEGILRQRC